jgi:peptidoglycan/xylan/chitin deacetylase (PgdA/CDA1 family)
VRYGAGRSVGKDGQLTRRGLLGAAVLISGAGLADLLRVVTRSSPARPVGSPRRIGSLLPTSSADGGSIPRSPGSTPTAGSPITRQTASHTPAGHTHERGGHGGHQHGHTRAGHQHGHRHEHHETPAERRRTERERAREEHVTLPPAKLRVRTHPAYQVDELIPNPPKRSVALTIDDGPDPEWTPHVLRLLDKFDMQASFCVVGEHADAYPRLVRDIAKAGHVIVNHSYTHYLPFTALSQKRMVWEITKTQRAIEQAAKVTPQLFRSPGGDWSPFLFRALASYGLEPLDWDVDPQDWMMPGSKTIERRMLKARPGEIVLCHDGGGNRSETVKALRKVLPSWQRRGLATIPLQITSGYLTSATATVAPTTSPSPTSS